MSIPRAAPKWLKVHLSEQGSTALSNPDIQMSFSTTRFLQYYESARKEVQEKTSHRRAQKVMDWMKTMPSRGADRAPDLP
jgi:hypothetical protein